MARHERIRCPISTKELERRWAAIRNEMRMQEIDALIAQNDNNWMGGYFRYFTDIPAEACYPKTVFFPVNDEMHLVCCGGDPFPAGPPDWAIRGVGSRICLPYFRTVNFTNQLDAEMITKHIKDHHCKKVGFVGLGAMGAAFHKYVVEHCKEVEFVDAGDLVDEIKAVKSGEELVMCIKACECQDIVCAAMPTIIRPGRYEYQIRADINHIMEDLGSEEQLIMMGSAPMGQKTGHYDTFYQNRRIERGDQVLVMIETNGPGGFYGEIGRIWTLGEPSKELLAAWDDSVAAQAMIAQNAKPGTLPGELLKANNEFMVAKGYAPEGRMFAHSQGYDLVERPAFVEKETMCIKENMFVAIHPIVLTPNVYVFACDDFIVTGDGAKRVHKTPLDIIQLDC